MINEGLQKQLLALIEELCPQWQAFPRHDTENKAILRWLPVAYIAAAKIQLGISSDAYWVRLTPQGAMEFKSDSSFVFLLPMLEIPFHEVIELIGNGLKQHGLSIKFLKGFPSENIAITGLSSCSEHWADLALNWTEQLPPTSNIQSALQTLAQGGPTQRLRHKAQKFLAQRHKRTS